MIRFSSLTDFTETGNGTTGWIYTSSATNALAAGSDYTLAAGVAGGISVQVPSPGGASPLIGWYTTSGGGIIDDYFMLAFVLSGNWVFWDSTGTDFPGTTRAYAADDYVRIRFDTGNGIICEVARAGTPNTWLEAVNTTQTRGALLYPKLGSLFTSGAVLTAPQSTDAPEDPAEQAETITFSDSLGAVAKFVGSSSESITFADSQAATADFIAAQAESITLSDSQIATNASAAAQDESLTLVDSAVAVQASPGSAAETITLSDAVVSLAHFAAAQDESISLVDSQDATEPGEAEIVEQITMADSQSATQVSSAHISESITFIDAIEASGDDPIIDTHDGFWVREWKKMVEREKKLSVEEVMEIVEEAPKEVLEAIPEVKKQVKKEFGRVDYQRIANNLQMQRFIAEQILVRHEMRMQEMEEDDLEVLLIL